MKIIGHKTLRTFPTMCKHCGMRILYWESVQGAKVFFNLPMYGKPIRHICQRSNINKRQGSFVKETAHDHLKKKVDRTSYQCPVCGKIYAVESALNNHLIQQRRLDDPHAEFYEMLEYVSFDENEEKDLSPPPRNFATAHSIETLSDRFILKTKNDKQKKTFEKLIKPKRTN